jgi:hypothetical protein
MQMPSEKNGSPDGETNDQPVVSLRTAHRGVLAADVFAEAAPGDEADGGATSSEAAAATSSTPANSDAIVAQKKARGAMVGFSDGLSVVRSSNLL